MRKIHGRKQAVSWTLAGAVTGGLVLYGAVWLGRRIVAAPAVKRVVHFLSAVVRHSTDVPKPAAETVFQADPTGTHEPGWTPPGQSNVYGPN